VEPPPSALLEWLGIVRQHLECWIRKREPTEHVGLANRSAPRAVRV